MYQPLSLNAHGENTKTVAKEGKQEDGEIVSVIDIYLFRKGMSGQNYESCLSNCTMHSLVTDLRIYNVCCFYM